MLRLFQGEIDASELGKILEALGEDHSEDRVSAAIAEVDLNANGKISFDEFVKFVSLIRSGDRKAVCMCGCKNEDIYKCVHVRSCVCVCVCVCVSCVYVCTCV